MGPIVIVGVILAAILAVVGIISANLKICQPNEVLVFSGKQRTLPDGTKVGYRVIQGGRGFKIPILEKVDRIELTSIPLDLMVQNAYSKGGIPLNVKGVANIKVASQGTALNNALERLLGKSREEVAQIAKETLEGNLRGVVSLLTPEEVNEDRLKFAKNLIEEADHDMTALGIQLDTLKIQNVEDDRGYLDAIGRQQTAQIVAEAEIVEAEQAETAKLAQAKADKTIIKAENEVRVERARLAAQAEAEEAKVSVAALVSQAKAEQELAEEQIMLMTKRQNAEVVVKADAERKAAEALAKGKAARILEDGQAEVSVLQKKLALWREAGPDAERLFLIQMLPEIIEQVVGTVKDLKIDKITVVDSPGSQGGGVPAVFSQIAGSTPALLESLKASTGIDVAALLSNAANDPVDANVMQTLAKEEVEVTDVEEEGEIDETE